MPQSHGTRRRSSASQKRGGSRRRDRRAPRPAPSPRDTHGAYDDPYGLDEPYEPYGDDGDSRRGRRPRDPGPPPRRDERRPRRLRRILTSNVTITVVALGVIMAGVVLIDLEELTGEKSEPPGAAAGLSANDMLAMMSGSDMDAVSAGAIAAAKKRAYEQHQRDLAELKKKAERDAQARAKLKAEQERERLAKSNPTAKQNKAYGKKMNELKGWGRCWPSLETLWDHESDWNERAENPSSGAYGIPQALPASKLATAGSDWRTSSPTQIAWGLSYIKARYKDPCRAWAFWQSHNWY
ncbi:cell envelope integrity protein TolA [Actinomadura rugatobispora]|uniref:Cell envelope integrity protein TolA n=1 Tax=Actinomadura rugatobispora TaxID=1994 RepID=A0ABW0ZQT9_9ACTN|nr:hypothetical protein GCM10010200_028350 [Actinomadura rugatobispora]